MGQTGGRINVVAGVTDAIDIVIVAAVDDVSVGFVLEKLLSSRRSDTFQRITLEVSVE